MADLTRRAALSACAAAALPLESRAQTVNYADDPGEVLRLWPGQAPGAPARLPTEVVTERSATPATLRDRYVEHVAVPTLTVLRPARPNGAAMLIIPGGGYQRVVIDKEGFETARWLNARGVTAFVLRYRLPGDGWTPRGEAPLQDAQRAVRLLRQGAASLRIDPGRVAVLGFSAGGHLAASLATRHAAPTYASVDAADALTARPDLAVLGYPVILMEGPAVHAGSRTQLLGSSPSAERIGAATPSLTVGPQTPPTLILHAADDASVPVENALAMFTALRAAGRQAELHVFEEGGHGFGLRAIAGKPVAAWPDLMLTWLNRHGYSDPALRSPA
ncbi:MAG: alpha/beta hydrolase [Proteobacteria bacterium]|nr:alpha/beta hydrolase [Pseudomonadota bacterium]